MAETNGRRAWLLAIDTATSRVVVGAGDLDGRLLGAMTTEAGHRHGERLLPMIGRLTGAPYVGARRTSDRSSPAA